MRLLDAKPAMRLAINRRLVDAPRVGRHYLRHRAVARPLLPDCATDAYVDGFPRSANSYAFYAFRASNPGLQVAGHLHSADVVRSAIGMGIPVMLLIRDPLPCAASFMRYVPGLRLTSALQYYHRFHRRLVEVRSDIFVASFDDVIFDFGTVLQRFSEDTQTPFVPYAKTPENEAMVARMLDHANAVYASGRSHTLARPTPARKSDVPRVSDMTTGEVRLLADCTSVYREFLG